MPTLSQTKSEFYGRNLLHPRIAAHHPFHYKKQGTQYRQRRETDVIKHRQNGRIFAVECIIFQDDSFEISINDITQEKEQALLKNS